MTLSHAMRHSRTAMTSALCFAAIATISACSTAEVRTMPSQDGNHRVVARDIEKTGAERAANDAARDFCKDQGKVAYFSKDSVKYTGSMDEATRNTVRNASRVASVIGVPGNGFGQPDPVRTAGMVGHGMTNDKDYEAEVQFTCK